MARSNAVTWLADWVGISFLAGSTPSEDGLFSGLGIDCSDMLRWLSLVDDVFLLVVCVWGLSQYIAIFIGKMMRTALCLDSILSGKDREQIVGGESSR